ncbi:MAG: hypothetical protein IEMM0008_0541 [bacterium]|nr:MAG: hypothetical protein IEMM0008_0541 [bacterium]
MNKDYLEDMLQKFKDLKALCEKAIHQMPDEHFFSQLDGESNSIANILKHIGGSMASRWTDFLTTDGEKPNRHRDEEFIVESGDSKERILEYWERGWQTAMNTLNSLSPRDLSKTVFVRTQAQSVVQAINQQLSHCSLHIGQIIFLSKHFASDWTSLTIPKGESEQYNRKMKSLGDKNKDNIR